MSGDSSKIGYSGLLPIFLSLNIFYNIKKLKLDTSKALFWVTVSFTLYHVVPLLFYNFINVIEYLDVEKASLYQSLDSNILTKTFLMSTIGFQSTVIVYAFSKINNHYRYQNQRYNIYIVYISILLFFAGFAIRKYVPIISLSMVEAVTFLIISIYIYSNSRMSTKTKKYLAILVFLTFLILLSLNTTGRRDLIKLIIVFSILWSIYIRPFRLTYILLGGLFSIFVMLSLVLYRTTFSFEDVWSRILLMFKKYRLSIPNGFLNLISCLDITTMNIY